MKAAKDRKVMNHFRPFVRSFVRRSIVGRLGFSDFRETKISEMKEWVVAINFAQKSSKSEPSSRFLSRFKILQDLEGHHETCEVPIWRSCDFLSVTMKFVSQNHPRCPKNQLSMTFGGGVKNSISIFFLTFGPKLTCTFWLADMMT